MLFWSKVRRQSVQHTPDVILEDLEESLTQILSRCWSSRETESVGDGTVCQFHSLLFRKPIFERGYTGVTEADEMPGGFGV